MFTRKKGRYFNSVVAIGCLFLAACGKKTDDEKIRDYIATHPEEIVNSVLKYREAARKKYERARREALAQAVRELVAGGGVVVNPAGRVHVVEILDYNCGYCKEAFKDIERRAAGEWKDVRFTLVPLPIISQDSKLATMVTRLAIANNARPLSFMDALLEKRVVDDSVTRQVARAYSIKVDDAGRFASPVTKDAKAIEQLGIKGTPTFIVGSAIITGYRPKDLSDAIVGARAEISKMSRREMPDA